MPGRSFKIKKAEIPTAWLIGDEKLKNPDTIVKINIEFEPLENKKTDKDIPVLENLGDSLISGFKDIVAYKKGELKLREASELFKDI